ncbi:heparinase II/III family protein [Mycobacterium neglectum]|uniref:heparinase II/III family protein n=1 Tax=Mycobacterium neglectum TaxID=242737 RepID=UPI001FE9AB2B|nr:alginate lyase family protein [Mycobacterium neglectum]
MSSLAWYWGRLKAMSPHETAWRASRAAASLQDRTAASERTSDSAITGATQDWGDLLQRFRGGLGRPVLLDADRAQRIAVEHRSAVNELIAEADRLVAGQRRYFGYPTADLGTDVDWNYDPVSNYRWPTVRSTKINHRTAPSDPKWIWELNRLQHLPQLAQAWLFTEDPVYAETAFEHLDSWLTQNPAGSGIAWRGAFEAGIRAISVAIAVQGLRTSPALTAQRYRRVARMLDASARYCWRERSRFSSANNHLVGELAGLATVHLLFPELDAPAALFDRCIAGLSAEAEQQILSDGAGAEQAISYQIFTAELLSLVVVLLRLRGDVPPPALTEALHRSSLFLSYLVCVDDPDPRYGDDDDGFALRLGAESKRTVRQHLAIMAAASGAVIEHTEPTLAASWISTALDGRISEAPAPAGRPVPTNIYAPDGGLVVMRSGRRRVVMDVGPLGYLSTASHGHADALAVTLSDDGRDLIVDPGTASYYGNAAWRSTHRGTRVHATVCVDGLDQSVIGGPFLWSRHAKTVVRFVDLDRGIVDAEHHGYRRLDDPVLHRRWLIAPPGDATVAVVDLIDGQSTHDVTVSWPLSPDLTATPTDVGHRISRDGEAVLEIRYAATGPVHPEQVSGDRESHLGWWSDRLESRTPSWLVGAKCRSSAPMVILSLLRTVNAGALTDPAIAIEGCKMTVSWSEDGIGRGFTIDRNRPGAVEFGPFSQAKRVVSVSE